LTLKSASLDRPNRRTLGLLVFMTAVIALVIVVRARALPIPLERDEGEYAYMGQLMLEGVPPYKLAYNMKLPGTYASYAALMAVFGQTISGIHLGFLLVNLGSLFLLFQIARRWAGLDGAAIATAAFALMTASPGFLGLQAHATHLVVFFALAGIWSWQRAQDSRRETNLFFSGLFFGLSFVCKQPGFCFGMFGAAMILRDETLARPIPWKAAGFRVALFLFGLALPFGVTCLWLWRCGVFPRFWFWTVTYARAHAALLTPDAIARTWSDFIDHLGWNFSWCLWAAAGIFALFSGKDERDRRFPILALLGFSIAAFCGGFYFTRHYFILVLPVVSLLIAVAVEVAWVALPRLIELPAWAGFVLFAAVCLLFTVSQSNIWFYLPPYQASRALYLQNPFAESPEIANYIREHSAPDARVAIFGSEPQIYFYAHRRSATGYIYMYDLVQLHRYAHAMQQEMKQQALDANPQFVVLVNIGSSWLPQHGSEISLFYWCDDFVRQRYDLVGVAYILPTRTECLWGADAVRRPAESQLAVFIYQRKEALDSHSAKT